MIRNSTSTGHVINVANFETLIAFCAGYKDAYQPGNPLISLDALRDKAKQAREILAECSKKRIAYENAVGARIEAFKDLKPLATRIISALSVSGVSSQTMESARSINRRIQGKRLRTRKSAEEQGIKTISSSQLSYDTRISNLDSLIAFVSTHPEYQPHEPMLRPEGLRAFSVQMKTLYDAVGTCENPWYFARASRDNALYSPDDGLVRLAGLVKGYLKSVFGAADPAYAEINRLQFRTLLH